ncbi:MAG TPA: elongation factor 4, partial [Candidatus Gracilibacteria bacterium]|nr:elongation factor 4 [Candidatus Gracilibacteria bacterium]
QLPDLANVKEIREPYVKLEIIIPQKYIGGVMDLATASRGDFKGMDYVDDERVILNYEIPLASIISDFFDSLKSITQGYASMNYDQIGFRASPLVRVDILVAGDKMESLSIIAHRDDAESEGRKIAIKLKEAIPKHQFPVSLQAVIGGKIIARETVPAMRKDVTAKLYGGDVSRKKKVLEKQKEGKKRLKAFGRVNLSQEAFLTVLKRN